MAARDSSQDLGAVNAPLPAQRVTEEEFARLSADLVIDPAGDLLWLVASSGPLPAEPFSEG